MFDVPPLLKGHSHAEEEQVWFELVDCGAGGTGRGLIVMQIAVMAVKTQARQAIGHQVKKRDQDLLFSPNDEYALAVFP
jgi:hypothetical protein